MSAEYYGILAKEYTVSIICMIYDKGKATTRDLLQAGNSNKVLKNRM